MPDVASSPSLRGRPSERGGLSPAMKGPGDRGSHCEPWRAAAHVYCNSDEAAEVHVNSVVPDGGKMPPSHPNVERIHDRHARYDSERFAQRPCMHASVSW